MPEGSAMQRSGPPATVRTLPELNMLSRFFWESGADGRLRILRCEQCEYYVHPPSPRCPRCLSADVSPHEVSGRATVKTFTVNHQAWQPDAWPYVVAIVELREQVGLRLTTNIVNCDIAAVSFGMPVEVVFEQLDDVFLPVFQPVQQ